MTNEDIKEKTEAENEAAGAAEDKASEKAAGSAEEEKKAEDTSSETADAEKKEDAAEAGDASAGGDKAYVELNKKYMRLAADFQNFKRRTEKEKSDIYQYANEKIALDIIGVIDNFERALTQIDDCQDKQFAEGVEKIYKQLKGVLEKNKIEEIEAQGKPFDPNFHNAVMTTDDSDYDSGIVVEDMQKGYTLNGKVIRPTMVKVSQ